MEIARSETALADRVGCGIQLNLRDLDHLDFEMIKLKLQDVEEGQGWSSARCDEVEKSYKRFLALKRAYPDKDIVPNRDVDIFWHQHILDTERYAEDCQVIFGKFLHHYPYFGMQGDDDYLRLCAAFDETADLYSLHFSESWGGAANNRAKCRTKCKPMRCK
ncbi:MAG: glycine-rich domain-containing protein-like [Acidobacteriota bacterium]